MLNFLRKIKSKFWFLLIFLWLSMFFEDHSKNYFFAKTLYFTINDLSSTLLYLGIFSFLVLNFSDIVKDKESSHNISEYLLPIPLFFLILLNDITTISLILFLLFLLDNIIFNSSKREKLLLLFNFIYILVFILSFEFYLTYWWCTGDCWIWSWMEVLLVIPTLILK